MTGFAAAAPDQPINPLVEGRESNPVDREYYRNEKQIERYGSGPANPMPSKGEWVKMLSGFSEILEEAWQLFR
jgi:hypothetical protein